MNSYNIQYPERYPEIDQLWYSTPLTPYPMNFVQAPSAYNQVLVQYQGQPMLQGLSTVRGPFMYPVNAPCYRRRNYWHNPAIVYPMTHSIPGPFLQTYINLA